MNDYHLLTARERYIYTILLEITHDSTYGQMIERLRDDPTPDRLTSNIDILTKAALVDPGAMSLVIGCELVDILLQGAAQPSSSTL